MAQFARPDADDAFGNWAPSTGGDLYATIDESVASDADYIEDQVVMGSACEISLSSVTDPATSTGHIVRWRDQIANWTDDPITLVIELREGTTVIATARSGVISNSSVKAGSYTLSGAEANNITDYTDLNLKCTANGQVDDGARVRVTWAEFEVPDAGRKTNPLAGPLKGLI